MGYTPYNAITNIQELSVYSVIKIPKKKATAPFRKSNQDPFFEGPKKTTKSCSGRMNYAHNVLFTKFISWYALLHCSGILDRRVQVALTRETFLRLHGLAMDPKPQTTATSSPENSDELAEQESLPVLPLEVLSRTLDYLEDVKDLANVAMTCREWRELINSCDECWEHAFMRDYNQWSAKDYDNLPTWRQRYM